MTMTTGDPRLEVVEARLEDLREGQRESNARLDAFQQQMITRFDAFQEQMNTRFDTFQEQMNTRFDAFQEQINARFDAFEQQINARVDRLTLALLAVGVTQIGVIITLVIRGN